MSFAMSMQAPLHSPLVRSFWKYGSSPGNAAMRSVLVRRMRSNVVSLADCALADWMKAATGISAAAAASDRRPGPVVMVGVSQISGRTDPQSDNAEIQSPCHSKSEQDAVTA